MLTSSIWTTPHPKLDMIRCVWMTLMLMADKRGYVHASIPGLAAQAVVSIENAAEALELFRSPDPYSRTKEHEGRRLIDVEGGWLLLNYASHRGAAVEELSKQSKRDWYHRNKVRSKTRDDSLVESSPRTLDVQPSVSVSDLSPDQSLAGPDQGESEPDSEQPTSSPITEAQGSGTVWRNLDGFEPDEALVAEAITQGLTREEFAKYLDDARDGPIGGQRGVFNRRKWVLKQLPRWRTWAEEARSKAVHRPGSTGNGSAGSGKGRPWRAVLEPTGKHRAYAKKYGLDLHAICRQLEETGVVEELGHKRALELLGQKMSQLAQHHRRDTGERGSDGDS